MLDLLLEVLRGSFGLSAIGCLLLALISFFMMLVGIARSNSPRIQSASLLLAGVVYAAANVGVFVVVISVDAFNIFKLAYVVSVGFVGPAFMIIALVVAARVYKQLGWLSIVGFAVWVGCAGFAHLWVIAAASASV